MRKVLFGVAISKLLLLALVLLSLALSYIPDQAYHPASADTASQDLHVIEFNDLGLPHDPDQLKALTQRIARQGGKAELLIFIHGWHHSAAPDDENFLAFQQFYQQMASKDPQRNLLGLYIGWRGDKYDPLWLDGSTDATSQVEALDFLTIFERKAVARRIGKTGFSMLLDELDKQVNQGQLQRYTVLGHSLGGAMALHASKKRLTASIAANRDNPNLFVLLNPAVRASEYKPMDQLLSVDRQKPAMVVLQSKTDFALTEAWQWLRDGERVMGNSWAITHDIDRCPRGDCSIPLSIPKSLQAHDAKPGCLMTLPGSGWKVRARLQARRTVQTCQDANMQAVWVLAVSDDIISGHNGILTTAHAGALAEVMAMIDRYHNKLPQGSAALSPAATAAGAETASEAAAEELLNGEVPKQQETPKSESQNPESQNTEIQNPAKQNAETQLQHRQQQAEHNEVLLNEALALPAAAETAVPASLESTKDTATTSPTDTAGERATQQDSLSTPDSALSSDSLPSSEGAAT